MKQVNLQFFVDVSGVPYETTYVGVIVSTPQIIEKTIKAFKKEKNLFSKKARQLKSQELFNVLKIMDNHELKMITAKFTHTNWNNLKNEFGSKKDFKHKVLGYIYYKLFQQQELYTNFSYFVFTCSEDHLNINEVHKQCRALALADKIKLNFSIATAELNEGVKLADFVAQAMRKNKIEKLKKLKNLKCIKIEIDNKLLQKLF
jgi:hypothetical protein